MWDTTTNKCFWDASASACRWTDECINLHTREECITSRCSWQTLCTPADMRALPGPASCSETCVIPRSDSSSTATNAKESATVTNDSGPALAQVPVTLTDIVRTTVGDVKGIQKASVQEFLGIPFAQPPVGANRWKPPQELSKWEGTFNATSPGPSCLQSRRYFFSDTKACQGFTRGRCQGYSEDCLKLNIWTPSTSGSRAVMVWIHGGCFVSGSPNSPSYDGTNMATAQDVVIVNLGYRLGPFGFLGADVLRPRDPQGSTGNYGLMDNVAALKWIQANIAKFGGDPERVTIFGESSGAGSVSQLLGVKEAWSYFHRGIMESGTGSFWTMMDIDAAYRNFKKVTASTKCTGSSNVVNCLVNASSSSVLYGVSSVPCRDSCNWTPVVDGVYIKGPTLDLARAGQLRPDTQTIAGFNLNDGAMFVPGFPIVMGTMSSNSLHSYYAQRFGSERVSELSGIFPVQTYVEPNWLSKYFYSSQKCETDFSYSCTAQWVSTAMNAYGSTAYVYQFSEPTSYNGLVLHGDDIGYVFGTLSGASAQQKYVMSIMMAFWANFAKTGDPNEANLPSWPKWEKSAALLNISANSKVQYFQNNSFVGCKFFNDHWDYYGGCLPENPSTSVSEFLI